MTPDSSHSAREHLPHLPPSHGKAYRARLVYGFDEAGERQEGAEEGWARIDGPWVLWLPDEQEHWQSWPMDKVTCIDWEPIHA